MAKIQLDPRLMAVAGMVRPGVCPADIGTDHGLVVAYLIENGVCNSAVATDIADGPLKAAKSTLSEAAPGAVKLIRCDGLRGLSPTDAQDIIIAGMGGELIARILEESPEFHLPDKHFILQPMTKPSRLRKFLIKRGFAINEERPVMSSGKPYVVMSVTFTGDIKSVHPAFYHIGRLPLPPDAAGCHLLLKTRASMLKKRLGATEPEALADIDRVISSLDIALQGGDPYGS